MAGLLFGRAAEGRATVEVLTRVGFDNSVESALTIGERLGRAFDESISQSKLRQDLASLELIGWWCVRAVDDIRQLKKELKFHNRRFRRMSDILLVLKSGQEETASASLYARLGDPTLSPEHCSVAKLSLSPAATLNPSTPPTISSAPSDPDSYVNVSRKMVELEQTERSKKRWGLFASLPALLRRSQSADGVRFRGKFTSMPGAVLASVRERVFIVQSTMRKSAVRSITAVRANKIPLLVSLAFLVVASGVSFAPVHFRSASAQSNQPHLASPRPNSALHMQVDLQPYGALVRWSRDNEVLQSANRGVLRIEDGSEARIVELDLSELGNGSLLYRPTTRNVNFQLTVYRRDGSTLSDSVRAVDGSKQIATPNAAEARNHTVVPAGNGTRTQPGKDAKQSVSIQPTKQKTAPLPTVTKRAEPGAVLQTANSQTHGRSAGSGRESSAKGPTGPGSPALARQSASANGTRQSAQSPASPVQAPADAPLLQTYTPPRPAKTVMVNAALFEPSLLAGITQIEVGVDIDETGHVTAAQIMPADANVSHLVANVVLSAAKQWSFEPAKIGDRNIPAKHVIVFHFSGP